MIRLLVVLLGISVSGCAGKLDVIRPTSTPRAENSKIIEKPREAVWKTAVPALGKQFFVINNIDQSSGLINLSYSGDPEAYVDCGRIVSYVSNARGERTYDFPGAKSEQSYEIMNQGTLLYVQRNMSLEGRMNLIFEEMGPSRTRVTANTRYALSRAINVRTPAGAHQNFNHSISFNSGSRASFAASQDGRATECIPTGRLEQEVLSLIN